MQPVRLLGHVAGQMRLAGNCMGEVGVAQWWLALGLAGQSPGHLAVLLHQQAPAVVASACQMEK